MRDRMNIRRIFGAGALLLLLVAVLWVAVTTLRPSQAQEPAGPRIAPEAPTEPGPALGTAADAPTTPAGDAATTVTLELEEPRPPETVVARTSLGPITLSQLQDYYAAWSVPIEPQVPLEAVARMPADWLHQLGRIYGLARLARDRMEAELAESPVEAPYTIKDLPPARREFEEYLISYALDQLTRREILEKVAEPGEEEIREYYEARKEQYFQPATYAFRQLFLETYEPYTVAPGDDLPGIAERVNGDPEAIDNIRLDAVSRPRRWVPPGERQERLFNPLYVGEKLLVPMNEEKAGEVRSRLEALLKQVEEGESFADVAKEHSEDGLDGEIVSPFPSGFTPFVDQLLPALEATPPGGISNIFRSVHGWHAVQVINRTPASYRSLADVRGEIADTLKQQRQEALDQALSRRLYATPGIEIHFDTLEKAPDLPDDAVVLTIRDRAFTWDDFRSVWERQAGPGATPEVLREAIRYFQPAQFALALIWAEESGLWDEPEAAKYHENLRAAVFAKQYLEQEIERRTQDQITEEMIREVYDDNADQFMTAELVSYELIEQSPSGEFHTQTREKQQAELERLKEELNRQLGEIDTLRDFTVLADDLTALEAADEPDPMAAPEGQTAHDLDVTKIESEIARRLADLEPGQWSEAWIQGDKVRAVALTDRKPPRSVPIAQVRPAIERELLQALMPSVSAQLTAEMMDRLQYEPVLRDKDGKSG